MIDRQSATWREVSTWAGKELADASERNGVTGLGLAETENLRGRIAALSELLALREEPEARVAVQVEDYGLQGADDA